MVKLNSGEVEALLHELCVTYGFCLPPDGQTTLRLQPPTDVTSFVTAVYRAEGMDPATSNGRVYRQVHDAVAAVFRRTGLYEADT